MNHTPPHHIVDAALWVLMLDAGQRRLGVGHEGEPQVRISTDLLRHTRRKANVVTRDRRYMYSILLSSPCFDY